MLYPIDNEFREVRNLNGTWDFKVDFNDEGFAEKWYEKRLDGAIPMAVPASYNDLVTDERIRDYVGWVWYQRKISIPNSWADKRVVLRFGSVTHHARVFIDGIELGTHKGGFLPFEFEISNSLLKDKEMKMDEMSETLGKLIPKTERNNFVGDHLLTVAVSNVLDWTCLPCGEVITNDDTSRYPKGYRYQETFFDFYNFSGIHRPVKLYATAKKYIKDIVIKTDVNGEESADVDFKIIINEKPESLKVRIIDEDDRVVATACMDGKMIATEDIISGSLKVDNPILWQPGKGYLYRLEVTADEDKYTENFGIRTVKVEGDRFLINGKPFYFKGFGKHEDSDVNGKGLNEALNIRDFNLLKWMGANSIRTSHYPYAEELMDLADREGMVVIDEVPAVGMAFWDGQKVFDGTRVNGKTLEHHSDCLEDMYNRDKNRPCVVMWSVANEAATYEPESVPYFTKVINKMRSLDNSRPVTMVHTSPAESDRISDMLDVVCVNRYYGWYTDHSHLEVIGLQLEKEMLTWHNRFGKPVIMTEYGADTIPGLHKFPPVTFSEEFQCEFLEEYHKVFDRLDFVIGEHVWAFADFATKQGLNRIDGNKKGVFTRNRQPKMAAFKLRERWKGKENGDNSKDKEYTC